MFSLAFLSQEEVIQRPVKTAAATSICRGVGYSGAKCAYSTNDTESLDEKKILGERPLTTQLLARYPQITKPNTL